jgi:phage anti-repressor protein
MAKKKKEAGTGKFDKKQISTGTVYTRKHEEEDEEDEEDNDAPKKKGRKEVGTGRGKKIGAKVKGTSKLASKGSIAEDTSGMIVNATGLVADLINRTQQQGQIDPKELVNKLRAVHKVLSRIQGGSAVDTLRPETKPMAEDDSIPLVDKGEYDREGDMALNQLHQIEDAAEELHSILDADENLPEWVQSKITKAVDYIDTARDYIKAKKQQYTARGEIAEPIAEKAVSKQQQKFMGMAHAMQKGEKIKGASPELKKVAKSMKKSDVEDFAATKHEGLPKKVKEADVEPKAKKTGGIEFGKGIYESINSRVEKMITEGMNVSVNMSTNEHGELTKNITVSAEGDEAESLAQLLNLAGMSSKQSACGCGQTPCGCNTVEEAYSDTDPTENKPDYPTDAQTTGEDDELLRRWAGGLNKPKSTGQTTIPVVASQTDRQVSEQTKADKLGMNLYAELKQFKAQ